MEKLSVYEQELRLELMQLKVKIIDLTTLLEQANKEYLNTLKQLNNYLYLKQLNNDHSTI